MNLPEAVYHLEEKYSFAILEKKEFRGETTLLLKKEYLYEVAQFCRDFLGFAMLLDISSVDQLGQHPRFEMVYELCSLEEKKDLSPNSTADAHSGVASVLGSSSTSLYTAGLRAQESCSSSSSASSSRGPIYLRLKTLLSEEEPTIPTVSTLWATANWHEREVYDMMGIRFEGHPNLRRILMWDGYPYYPLRKDFPLEGKPSEMPEVAFSQEAPLQGGPFVSTPSPGNTQVREPRHRSTENPTLPETFIVEP